MEKYSFYYHTGDDRKFYETEEVDAKIDELAAHCEQMRLALLKNADDIEALEELSAQELSECTFAEAAMVLRECAEQTPAQSLRHIQADATAKKIRKGNADLPADGS